MTKKLLECIGINPARLHLEWISASEGPQFAQAVRDLVEEIKGVGPNPLGQRMER
jgi:F420-non-reducing hydrogenase iron-sulfur subunit